MIKYSINNSNSEDLKLHLDNCSDLFIPNLSSYVDITTYSEKIYDTAIRFEAFENELIGLIAVYLNDKDRVAFITNVSVYPAYIGNGISLKLLNKCKEYLTNKGYITLRLEVNKNNNRAINFYTKNNFIKTGTNKDSLIMEATLQERNYNIEFKDTKDHKYAYNFDFDIMHGYMIKSFSPFFNKGNLLELGSFKGDFTKRLLPYFEDITCVEASNEAIEIAKQNLGNSVKYVYGLFEDVVLPTKYDNIVLTHVLEHIDDPVKLLEKIKNEWLSEDGSLYIVCPNANAPSRQIAVKMGLITHNSAITPSEKEHGHRITYTLDTLERDAKGAKLNVIHRSGIFFKALANFQWDKILNTDIISKEYLDGCYDLGQQYPDLCSSIMLVCKK